MLAKRLRQLRLEAGLTQKQLADNIKTSQQNIGFYENEKRNPKKDILEKLANFFNTSTDYLLGKTDIRNSSELSDRDIEQILDTDVLSYEGEPLTDEDRKILKQVIKDYFDGSLKKYD